MPYVTHNDPTKSDKQAAIQELLSHARHSRDFYLLLISSTIIAIGGIFTDSVPLLIASMIVAPLAFPILTLGLGITVGDARLIGKTFIVLLIASLLTLVIAMGATYLFNDVRVPNVNITFTGDKTISFIVAVVSGAIAAYGLLQPKIASALTGIAIAVSLLPPLVATGIGIASVDVALTINAASIFGLNILGILVASVIVFTGSRMYREYKNR